VELLEGHWMPGHIHLCLSVSPKFSIAFVLGFLKEKALCWSIEGFWGRGVYRACTFGSEDTVLARLVWMKKPYANTFEIRQRANSNKWS